MTRRPSGPPRSLPRTRLAQLVPALVQGQHLVALVPEVGPLRWMAEAAWDFARAAASTGRSVALVDLQFGTPVLHELLAVPTGGGIADVIARNTDLSEAAREIDGVFFIPTGDATARDAVLGSDRWRKLHAGFRSQDALLLVFLNALDLDRLSALPDAIVLVAPDGVPETGSRDAAALEALEARGASLLGVVRERWAPAHPVLEPRPVEAARPPWRGRSIAAALATAILGAAGWALFARSATPDQSLAAPDILPATPPRAFADDTLPWTVQLAAYGTMDGALSHAEQLARDSIAALIAPVVPAGAQAVWYRVLAGSYVSRDSAARGRAAFWADGIAPEGQGDLLRAPYSLLVDRSLGPDSLRRLGVPATAWPGERMLVGAFESPEQAGFAEELVGRAGVRATVITRTGSR